MMREQHLRLDLRVVKPRSRIGLQDSQPKQRKALGIQFGTWATASFQTLTEVIYLAALVCSRNSSGRSSALEYILTEAISG